MGMGVGVLIAGITTLSAYFMGAHIVTLNVFLLCSIIGAAHGFLEDRSARAGAEAWSRG